jgi:arabinogalactan oligomer/maltooligosaccharide transport system permease protein
VPWLAAVFLLAAPEPLVLWHAWRGAEAEALQRVVADSPVPIRAVAMPFEGYSEKLSAALTYGAGPDLFIYPHERLGQWVQEGRLAELEAPLQALDKPAAAAFVAGGKRYGLPLASKGLLLFHNRALAADPAADLWPAAPQAKPLLLQDLNSYYGAFPWVAAFGARPFDADGKPALDSPGHRLGMAKLSALSEAGVVAKGLDGAQATAAFLRGDAPFLIDGPWRFKQLQETFADLGVHPLPKVAGQRLRPMLTVDGVFVASGGKRAADAARVAAYLASDASAETRSRGGRQLGPNSAVTARLSDDRPQLAAMAAALRHGLPAPARPEMRSVWGPAKDAVDAVLRRGEDPAEAFAEAGQRLASLLAPLPPASDPTPWLFVGTALLLGLGWRIATEARRRLPGKGARGLGLAGFIGPGLTAMLLLVAVPILTGFGMSLFAHGPGGWHFVGLANYTAIGSAKGLGLTHPMSFWFTLVVTVVWTVLNLVAHVGIGLGLALLLHRKGLRLSPLFRVLLILPWAIPNYVTALAWRGLFDEHVGAINQIIAASGGEAVAWWDHGLTAFSANLCTNIWLGFPFMMVIALGALSSIPEPLIEAARIDGASAWQRLRFVILPQLMPAMMPAILLGTIWTFNAFNVIYLVSGGAPAHQTDILVSEAYRWAFEAQGRYGYASAYSVLIFGLLLVFSRFTDRTRQAV